MIVPRVVVGLGLAAMPLSASTEPEMFPFVLPWNDATPGPTNFDFLLSAPAGKDGFVRAEDGHLFVNGPDGKPRRLRLMGVNLSFAANFPEPEVARQVAARLAKFGINSVRFHHMDAHVAPRGIFLPDKRTLDPEQVARFDYFFARLKELGIYADINLKVSRTYAEFAEEKNLPRMHKGVDLFNRTMIDAQKQFARDLLTHVNPHTGLSYANDPAVALIEINNENGLVSTWWQGRLDHLPEPFLGDLRGLWNSWLEKTFGSIAQALEECATKEAPAGKSLVALTPEPGILDHWRLLTNTGSANMARLRDDENPPYVQLRLQTDTQGNDEAAEYCRFSSPAVSLEKDRIYTLEIRARAKPARKIRLEISAGADTPGDLRSFFAALTDEWQTLRLPFQWTRDSEPSAHIRIADLEKASGLIEIVSISLQEGGHSGEPLEAANGVAEILDKETFSQRTPALQEAWMHFLWDTEAAYWKEMRDFLRNELGVQSPIIGTQLGAYSAFPLQTEMDVIDIHTYWKHPQYPKPGDSSVWTVGRESMMEDIGGGTIPAMMLRRVQGKPFVVTEYNHTSPNLFAGEGFLLAAAYGALHDIDGLFAYSYSHYPEKFDREAVPGLFDIDQHPLKMATMGMASAVFLRPDVAPSPTEHVTPVLLEDALHVGIAKGTRVDGFHFGVSFMEPLRRRTSLALTTNREEATRPGMSGEFLGSDPVVSETGELQWIPVKGRKSIFTMDTPRTKAVIGYSDGIPVDLDWLKVSTKENWEGWSVIALTSTSFAPLDAPGRSLLVACGKAENTDWAWKDDRKLSLKSWGKAPSLVNGITATLEVKKNFGRVSVWALDGSGKRTKRIPVQPAGPGAARFEIGPQHQTIWYEIETK